MTATWRSYLRPAFLVCVVVLSAAAVGMDLAIRYTGAVLVKAPVELRKPFDAFDRKALGNYRVIGDYRIDSPDVLESLGTDDYFQWEIEDPDAAENSTVRYCSLFVTFYGSPDRVPHVPEECYLGGGFRRIASELIQLSLPAVAGAGSLDVRYLLFVRDKAEIWQGDTKYPVMYFFRVNGEYANDRTGVREVLARNFFGEYSYFSKVEWRFYGKRYSEPVYPTREETVAASERLLSRVLPVLERDHWPIWDKR